MERIATMMITDSESAADEAMALLRVVKDAAEAFGDFMFGYGWHKYGDLYIVYVYTQEGTYGDAKFGAVVDICEEALEIMDAGKKLDMCGMCRYRGCPNNPVTCQYWVVADIATRVEEG